MAHLYTSDGRRTKLMPGDKITFYAKDGTMMFTRGRGQPLYHVWVGKNNRKEHKDNKLALLHPNCMDMKQLPEALVHAVVRLVADLYDLDLAADPCQVRDDIYFWKVLQPASEKR